MGSITRLMVLAACAFIGASQPVGKLPVLVEAPAELLFRVSQPPQPLTLPCSTTERVQGVSYKWKKDGKSFTIRRPDIKQLDGIGSLVLSDPKPEDEGDYQCFALFEGATASSRVIRVRRTYLDVIKMLPEEHRPIEQRPFALECAAPNAYPKAEITWERQSVEDPTVSSPAVNPRYTISPEGTLYFASAEREDVSDDSVYVCLGNNAGVDAPVTLAVHYIKGLEKDPNGPNHDVVHQYTSGDVTALYGQRLYLYCIYGETPLVPPDWYKDGKSVNNNPGDRVTRHNRSRGKRLLIREVWLEDQGTYTCTVDNHVGRPANHTMRLTVHSAPEFVKKPQATSPARAGQDLTIPCQVAGLPAPQVTWTYNTKPLQQDRYSISSAHPANNVTVADLTIKNLQATDNGYYGCHAVNQYGDVYAESLVHVYIAG